MLGCIKLKFIKKLMIEPYSHKIKLIKELLGVFGMLLYKIK